MGNEVDLALHCSKASSVKFLSCGTVMALFQSVNNEQESV